MTRISTLLCALTLSACAPEPGDDTDDGSQTASDAVVIESLGDDVWETTLDATDEVAWTYFDFESRAHVEPDDPATDTTWDLGALRFNVKSNGGTSGAGGGAVAILEGATFDEVSAPPADAEFASDTALTGPGMGGDAMANTSPGYVFDNWFTYNPAEHTLAPAPDRVYVVRTPEGNFYKLEMLGYYDDAGTPGHVRFRWAALG